MELVALYDSVDITQGPNLIPVPFYCYRCVTNNNTLFCHNLSSTGSSPVFHQPHYQMVANEKFTISVFKYLEIWQNKVLPNYILLS